jgi:methylated-DNA-[protein]-cysteine S-methyltransferase
VSVSADTPLTYWHEVDSPVGALLLAGHREALTRVHFQAGPHPLRPRPEWVPDAGPFAHVRSQLEEYFAGTRRVFRLRLAPTGTPFQLAVWQALRQIPYGQTTAYGELARRLGHAQAARAVGLANGSNPLPIIVPCHRVIGADGSLTGFGGGLYIKRALLALEGRRAPPTSSAHRVPLMRVRAYRRGHGSREWLLISAAGGPCTPATWCYFPLRRCEPRTERTVQTQIRAHRDSPPQARSSRRLRPPGFRSAPG